MNFVGAFYYNATFADGPMVAITPAVCIVAVGCYRSENIVTNSALFRMLAVCSFC